MQHLNEYHHQYYCMALEEASVDLASLLPRVLIVSRRTVRKNKFVDFVGEYHLDLIVKYGAVPVIVPRVSGLDVLLDSFEPIHGVLLCEGEDVDPSLYENDTPDLSLEEIEEIKKLHSSDTAIDKDKDSIEFRLARRCLERHIPFLGICRGSQVLNVACGGSLYKDVERELEHKGVKPVKHIDYNNYDGHRHPINVLKDTPLYEWFKGSLEGNDLELNVNSYHHQGVKKLAQRFKPMAYSPCGLIEAFYDPDVYNPEASKFIVGLQFHPERMRHEQDADRDGVPESVFDYPECPRAYQEFVKAVNAYQKKLLNQPKFRLTLDNEKHRQEIIQSFCFAKHLYDEQHSIRRNYSMHDGRQALRALQKSQHNGRQPFKELQISQHDGHRFLEVGANFLETTNTALNKQQEKMLKQVGATIRDSSSFLHRLHQQKDMEERARMLLTRLGTNKLYDLLDYYKMMVTTTSEVLEQRRNLNNN